MAARVNTKFVLILSGAMVMLFAGVLFAGWYIKTHNAPDLVRAGDAKMAAAAALMAAGDSAGASREHEAAEKLYSKAVNKERTNVEYLTRWRDCLLAWTPLTQTNYLEKFTAILPAALRQLALVKASDPQAHRDYLELLPSANVSEFDREAAEFTIGEVERTLGLLKAAGADSGPAQVIRRYRGLMLVRMMNERVEVSPEQVALALEDLLAARAVEPEDNTLVIGLYTWYAVQADNARNLNRVEEAEKLDAQADKVLTDALAEHPADPELMTLRLYVDVGLEQRRASQTLSPTEAAARMREVAAGLKGRLDALHDAFTQADPASITVARLGRFQDLETFIDPQSRWSRSIALMQRALEKRPADPELHLALAVLLSERAEITEAIALLQQVLDLPQPPLSTLGARLYGFRAQAVFHQAAYALQAWENAQGARDAKAGDEALAKAREYRARMDQYLGTADNVMTMYVDAMLKYAQRDWAAAKRLFTEYNSRNPRPNIKALWTLARVELNLNNPGAARQILEQVATLRPDLAPVQITLAEVEAQFKDYERAKQRLAAVLKVDTENPAARELETRIKLMTGEEAQGADPAASAIFAAQRMLDGTDDAPPDVAGATALLEEAIRANSTEPRLYLALVMLKAQNNDREGALAVAKAGLAAKPDSTVLAKAVEELGSADPLAWRLKQIDEAQAPDLEKELERYRTYLGAGKSDLAAAALERAAKLNPEDQRVVDQLFRAALRSRDFAAASRQMETAIAKDLDRNGGATYKGRFLAAQGQNAEAAAVLKELADRKAADVDSLRLLARLYIVLDRLEDAEAAYKQALDLRPNDTPVLVEYINAMSARGDLAGALGVARENERIGKGNPQFMELLLTLEATVGLRVGFPDPKDPEKDPTKKRIIKGALERREDILKRDPGNTTNTMALASLYIDLKRWDDARRLIDGLQAAGDSLEVAGLDARLHAAKGDISQARAVMDGFISRQGAAVTSDPFISFAQLLAELRQPNEALAMLERGRQFQTPKDGQANTYPVDRVLGDTLVRFGRPEAAIDVYKRIIDGNGDGPRQEVRTRLVDLLVTLRRYAEASQQIEMIKSNVPSLALTLLRADIASGLGDDKKARQIYDSAVATFAREPMVYYRRAIWTLSQGPAGFADALADLDAALRVRPSFWEVYRLRAMIFAQQGKPDEAIGALRDALRVNPNLDELRLSVMRDLVARGRSGEAFEIGEEAIRARPNDLDLFLNCAAVFSERQDWGKAERFLLIAWSIDKKRPDIAQAYLDSLLNGATANHSRVQEVLKELAESVESNSALLVARARLIVGRGGAMRDAARDLVASMNVVALEPEILVLRWFADVRRMLPKPVDALALLDHQEVPARFKDWATFLKATVLNESTDKTQALALLDQFLAGGAGTLPHRMGYRLHGGILYGEERYGEALKAWNAGSEKFPDDWELLNNIAYTMARYLGQTEQALPFAERAVKAAPQIGEALDTLGYIQMLMNRPEEAEVNLKKAFATSRQLSSQVAVQLHLAQLYILQGKKDKAREQLDIVEKILRDNPVLAPSHKKELEDLKSKAGSP